jgi:predicted kinase
VAGAQGVPLNPDRVATPVVHLLCGLNGAGKTTHARTLEATGAVRFSLDEWMLALHPGLRFDEPAWPAHADRCREVIWSTALQVLRRGVPVVLDWNLWSAERRRTWAERVRAAGFRPLLHHVAAGRDVAARRAAAGGGDRYALGAAEVEHLANLFEPPTEQEGLPLVVVPVD